MMPIDHGIQRSLERILILRSTSFLLVKLCKDILELEHYGRV